MRFRGLLLLLILLLFETVGFAEQREVKYLSFTAKDRFDIFVRDLEREEIRLRVDGEPVEVGFVGSSDVSTATAVFLENSPRTSPYLVNIPRRGRVNPLDRVRYEMLYNFFDPLCRLGPVLLAEYFDELEILQDFTAVDSLLANSIHAMEPMSTGIVFNNIEVGRILGRGVDLLRDRQERRKVLLLMTTTIDRESYQNLEEYKLMFRNTNIDLYVISFAVRFPSGNNFSFEEKMNRFFFRDLVRETGGRAYITGEYTYFEDLFTDLKGRLLNSYTVGFYVRPSGKVEEHEIEIELDREDSEVTHRPILVY